MPHIPESVRKQLIPGLPLIHFGKVRQSYDYGNPEQMAVIATDNVSIFDFVLPAQIPCKGHVLTAMNHFWQRKLEEHVPHDSLDVIPNTVDGLREHIRDDLDLLARTNVVRRLEMIPVEAIVRGFLTGSAYTAYVQGRPLSGQQLPKGLRDGDRLPYPVFTPTTKSKEGRDMPLHADSMGNEYGMILERQSLQLYHIASAIAAERGLILADTKLEFAADMTLADEAFTPDSSRFWDARAWENRQPGTSPSPFDKQYIRNWGKTHCIHELDPMDPAHRAVVDRLEVPADVIATTSQLYRYVFWRLTGMKLEMYQNEFLGVDTPTLPVHVDVVVGSESDLPQMKDGLASLRRADEVSGGLHVVSCHRNPQELANYAAELDPNTIVIAGAGMAAALPGVLKALIRANGKNNPVIGVAFEGADAVANQAAILSISQLPNQPVEMSGDGQVYFGAAGFKAACEAARYDEFLPKPLGPTKPAKFNITY